MADYTLAIMLAVLIVIVTCVLYYIFSSSNTSSSTTKTTTPATTTTTTAPVVTPVTSPAPVSPVTTADPASVCITGECLVEMYDGSTKRMDEIQKFDQVANGAFVICVIETCSQSDIIPVIEVASGLRVTLYHPIKNSTDVNWKFPDLSGSTFSVKQVYNLVLDQHHFVNIGDHRVLTLAHNIQDDPVAKHEFYGTQLVIDDLKTIDALGWERGHVVIDTEQFEFVRSNKNDHRVSGIYKK